MAVTERVERAIVPGRGADGTAAEKNFAKVLHPRLAVVILRLTSPR